MNYDNERDNEPITEREIIGCCLFGIFAALILSSILFITVGGMP